MKLDFSGVKILVVGDPMYDIYHFGKVDRISPEAPVPVFIEQTEETRDGGALNVLRQLTALGCDAIGAWEDYEGWGNSQAWTQKHRYMVGSHQVFRLDRDVCFPNQIPALRDFHAIVISDYAKGACTPELCQEAIASGLPVIVDPKGTDWEKYRGAAVICPNERENLDGHYFHYVVHKLGAKGLRLVRTAWFGGMVATHEYPAKARKVYDVTGAGDTVVAVIAAVIGANWSWVDKPIELACELANLAAGYVVGEVGTTVCPIEKLRELVDG